MTGILRYWQSALEAPDEPSIGVGAHEDFDVHPPPQFRLTSFFTVLHVAGTLPYASEASESLPAGGRA
jgi:hypothetical protein